MYYTDEQLRVLYKTPVTEEDRVDINDLVPNTLYLYKYHWIKALAEFISLAGPNGDYVNIKELTDEKGEPLDEETEDYISPYQRDQYTFYKTIPLSIPPKLDEEIKRGIKLVDPIHPLAELAYKQLSEDEKKDYRKAHEEGLVPPPPGSKRAGKRKTKRKRTTKKNRNSNRKRSRSLRGKTKTKTKTRKQK